MSKARLKITAIIMLVALVSIGISLGIKNKPKKFNIILIVVDALRADHLSCYGYNRNTSPNINKFAKEGVLFTNAYAQATLTRTSIPSIFTSLYPGVHGCFEEGTSLQKEFITLPEVLKKKGYITAAFVGPQLVVIPNFNEKFDLYKINTGRTGPFGPPLWEFITPLVNEKALSWLKQNHSKPFFVYLHYYDVRAPYLPPTPYNKLFWQGDVSEEMGNFIKHFVVNKYSDPLKEELLPEGEILDFIISQYDGKIKYMDEHIKALLEELERLNLAKNTLVILTSDHGEEFKDHGNFFHGITLYDELLRVPLIIRLPKVIPQGKIVSKLVRHIDIMPTILDILNIVSNNRMQGISLLSIIKGEANPKLEVFSEGHPSLRRKHLRSVRTEKWKFIEVNDFKTNITSYELYDLESDSKELNNLVETNPKEVNIFRAKLKDYNLSCEKIRKSILGESFVSESVMLDEETKKRLRSLGYIQ